MPESETKSGVSKVISVRIPDPILNQIDDIAKTLYLTRKGEPNRSQFILDAIEFYLKHNAGESTKLDSVNNKSTVDSVDNVILSEARVLELIGEVIKPFAEGLEGLEKKVSSLVAIGQLGNNTMSDTVINKPNITTDDTGNTTNETESYTQSDSVNDVIQLGENERVDEPLPIIEAIEQSDGEGESNHAPFLPEPLNQSKLAKRLGVDSGTLTKNKRKESFTDWSRRKDPANIGWDYDELKEMFSPV